MSAKLRHVPQLSYVKPSNFSTANLFKVPTIYVLTRLCSSSAGSSHPHRIAIVVYAVHHVSMSHLSAVPGRLAIFYAVLPLAFLPSRNIC
ncbi:hypothetical protein ElyMa_004328500 [Elysia marginata]|uniref:Uncharacterized protein n=1 Tax=Elysia marginata TaxID=1093978 RepID=A0AAV4H1R0_9GAST|nr:hypothetical protein ElyMa_004328500 [Elysia marginata]